MLTFGLRHLFAVTFALVMIGLAGTVFYQEPPIWGDEALYANLVENTIQSQQFGITLWSDTVPGIEQHAYWNPPLYFWLLTSWVRVTGLSITSLRVLSVLFATTLLFIWHSAVARWLPTHHRWPALATTMCLLYDFLWWRGSKVARPEMLVLLLGILGVITFWQGWRNAAHQTRWYFLSGLLCGLSLLTHPLAIIFPAAIGTFILLNEKTKAFIFLRNWVLVIACSAPLLIWLTIIVGADYPILLAQVNLAISHKVSDVSWIFTVFQLSPPSFALAMVGYLGITTSYLWWLWQQRVKPGSATVLLACVLTLSWILVIAGKMFWYYVLPLPFVYAAGWSMVQNFKFDSWPVVRQSWQSHSLRNTLLGGSFLLVWLGQTWNHIQTLNTYQTGHYSYEHFSQRVLEELPDHANILISTKPTLYFGLRHSAHTLYQYPVLWIGEDGYWNLLSQVDYVIYNGNQDPIMGEYLPRYLLLNAQDSVFLQEPDQYQAQLIKLVPLPERTRP